jgi:hypothetical protein
VLGADGQALTILQDEKRLPLKPGDPARTAPVVATETALLAALGDGGHPFAKVANRRVEIDKDTQTMEVTYTLDPGPVMRFGPVAIEGLERLDPAYLEGRLRRRRGEVYDASKVEETRRALIETGLFSTVKITPVADPDNPGDVRMAIDATERLHRTVGVGLAYHTSHGAGARAFWENRNLFGNAEYLPLSAEVGQQIDAFRANFRNRRDRQRHAGRLSQPSCDRSASIGSVFRPSGDLRDRPSRPQRRMWSSSPTSIQSLPPSRKSRNRQSAWLVSHYARCTPSKAPYRRGLQRCSDKGFHRTGLEQPRATEAECNIGYSPIEHPHPRLPSSEDGIPL